MLWSIVASIAVISMSGVVSKTIQPTPAPAATTTISPQSLPLIPDLDVSTLNNNNSDSDTIILEEVDSIELTSELSSIIDESSKTSKSKKNAYKSKYLDYIMSRNYKKSEYKEYVKNNKKDKIESKFELFIESDEYINSLNGNSTQPIYGHTKFSDWSDEEKKTILLSEEEVEVQRRRMLTSCYSFGGWGKGITNSVNYRTYAQPVQDQGICGACWAFASISQYEFNYLKYKGISQKQSEQWLIDGVSDSIGSCNGGWHNLANVWLANYGSCPDSLYYDYEATDTNSGGFCLGAKTSTQNAMAACISSSSTGYSKTSVDFWNIISNAAQYVSLSYVQAISKDFYYLTSSYYIPTPYYTKCDTSNIIGYRAMAIHGTSGSSLLIKNSFGTDWGDDGYFWLYYTSKDTCKFGDYFSFNYWY